MWHLPRNTPPPLPAGSAGEVGPVVDRGHGLVHQRVRLDERQRVVGEGGGGLVGGRRAFAGAAAGPVSKTDDEEKQRKRTDVKTASAVCRLVENRREKQVSRVTACVFFVFPLPFFLGCCTEMSVHHNNICSCKISIVGRQKKTCWESDSRLFTGCASHLGFGTCSSGTGVHADSLFLCSLNLPLKDFSMSSM